MVCVTIKKQPERLKAEVNTLYKSKINSQRVEQEVQLLQKENVFYQTRV